MKALKLSAVLPWRECNSASSHNQVSVEWINSRESFFPISRGLSENQSSPMRVLSPVLLPSPFSPQRIKKLSILHPGFITRAMREIIHLELISSISCSDPGIICARNAFRKRLWILGSPSHTGRLVTQSFTFSWMFLWATRRTALLISGDVYLML